MSEPKVKQNNDLQKLNGDSDTTPAVLLQLAVQQNLDIEKLEKLMQLQERWQANLSRKDFLSAVSKFQFSCPPLEKTKKVAFGQTKYSYAPLGEIAATIKKPMNDNGLSHRWEIEDVTDKIVCTCIISHINGHSEKTTMSAAKDSSGSKNEIQQRGSSITYLQRYTLIAALGISTADEDVDGRKEENGQNTTLHNHKDIVKDGKPVIPNKAYMEAIRRIVAGELDVYYKVLDMYSLEATQAANMQQAYTKAKELKTKTNE